MKRGKKNSLKKKETTVILVDWENLFQVLFRERREEMSHEFVSQGFLKLINQISEEVGEIVMVFVFAPPHLISLWEEVFWKQGFFLISCLKVRSRGKKDQDTVDETLIDMGRKLIHSMELTHLCVATGDKHFAPLHQDAILKELKTVTIIASESSLSPKLIEVSDKIILFPPIETQAG